jgi:membrane-bound lytic murein transglycosylase D
LTLSYTPSLAYAQVDATTVQVPPGAAAEALPRHEVREPLSLPETIDLTAEHDDLWVRIRNGFAMRNLQSEQVMSQQAWYMNRPDLLRRIVDRSRRYLYHIALEIEKRGMPMELALLPMVESSFNPMAYSPARASGLWQFIPSTGKTYKLEQNAWIDERRDIVASTSAALEYLQTIYEMHGDWHLALASYNWGENAVARAVAKNAAKGLPTDYLSLTMPAETRNYVPKLQALKNIFSNPKLVAQLDLPPVPNKPFFSTVAKPATMDIKLAAKLAEMPVQEFVALNPANNRPVIKEQNSIVLPADKVDIFQANLENHDGELTSWQSYTLKKGERLETIAARHGISVAQLMSSNAIGRRTKVGPGTVLLVPTSRDAVAGLSALPTAPIEPPRAAKKVAKGKRAAGIRSVAGKSGKAGKRIVKSGGGRQRVVMRSGSAKKTLVAKR